MPCRRVIVVQPKSNGITQITAELTRDTLGAEHTVFNADELRRLLAQHRHQHAEDTFESTLDVTQCLYRTTTGMKIMSDCMQRDLRKLKEAKVMRVMKSLWRLAILDPDDGTAHIDEPASAFVIPKPVRGRKGGQVQSI